METGRLVAHHFGGGLRVIMGRIFSKVRSRLTEAHFNFALDQDVVSFSIDQVDEIVLEKGTNSTIKMYVSRKILALPVNQELASVKFEANATLNYSDETIHLEEEIRKGLPELNPTFSRISLVISQATSQGFLGPIVTMPTYNENKVLITIK